MASEEKSGDIFDHETRYWRHRSRSLILAQRLQMIIKS